MLKPRTALIQHVQNHYGAIISLGSMSAVTLDPTDPYSVIKHTLCPAAKDFLLLEKKFKGALQLIQGELITDPKKLHNTYEGSVLYSIRLPMLFAQPVKAMEKKTRQSYNVWRDFLLNTRHDIGYTSFINNDDARIHEKYLIRLERSLSNHIIHDDIEMMIRSMQPSSRIDTKLKGNVLVDRYGNVVINDPVFSPEVWRNSR